MKLDVLGTNSYFKQFKKKSRTKIFLNDYCKQFSPKLFYDQHFILNELTSSDKLVSSFSLKEIDYKYNLTNNVSFTYCHYYFKVTTHSLLQVTILIKETQND